MDKKNNFRQDAHAVIIGINKYQDQQISDLFYARADAEGIYNVLKDPELGRIHHDNIILLLDEEATERNIRSAIGHEIPRRADEKDLVFIHYAGHGAPVIDPKGRSRDGMEKYLIPHDAEMEKLRATAISMDDINRFFGWIESKQVLFFIDSCYSGQAGGRTFQDPLCQKRNVLTSEFLDELAGEGRLVVTACDVNEVSLETADLEHGMFSYHLIEGLKGLADIDKDGLVTSRELYDYVFENVSKQARQLGGSMHPILKGSVRGRIFLTQYETEAQKRANPIHTQAELCFKTGKIDEAYNLWHQVLKLLPDHERAKQGMLDIENKRREEQQKRQQILDNKKRCLFNLYRTKTLPASEYELAIKLITKETEKLSESEREMRQFIDDLINEKISASTYLNSVEFLRTLSEPDRPEKQKEPLPKNHKKVDELIEKKEEIPDKKKPGLREKPKVEARKKVESESKVASKEKEAEKVIETPIAKEIKKSESIEETFESKTQISEETRHEIAAESKVIPDDKVKQPAQKEKTEQQFEKDKIKTKVVIPKPKSISFRSNLKELSKDDVKTTLKKYGFFCKEYDWNKDYCNPSGKGFNHNYKAKTINGYKVVFDSVSALMWQQGGSSKYLKFKGVFKDAKKWIINLNQEGYAGYHDWRLPTLEEAMSLIEPDKKNKGLYVDPVFDAKQSWIWTADPLQGTAAQWIVDFNYGRCYYSSLYDDFYVRAVRFGQPSPE